MSNIKSLFVKNVGWVISEVKESLSGMLTLTNPCIISGDGFIPMLHLVKEDELVLTKDDIFGGVFEPIQDLLEAYAEQFALIVVPENKIILH